jgi:hypothetical protein
MYYVDVSILLASKLVVRGDLEKVYTIWYYVRSCI